MASFDWVDFYREFAKKLLDYKDDRAGLIAKIKQVYTNINTKLPTLENGNNIVDIDPFTVLGLFNRGITDDNRIKVIRELQTSFGIAAAPPTEFDGIPNLNNQNAVFYWFLGNRGVDDINNLWKLFVAAMKYIDDPSVEAKKEEFISCFDTAINQKGNGTAKMTMGLYWIEPDVFLNLDGLNVDYIRKSGKFKQEIIDKLPDGKVSAEAYLEIIKAIGEYLKSENLGFNDFKELSYEAWKCADDKKQKEKADKKAKKDKGEETLAEESVTEADSGADAYGKDEFLREVYMSSDDYDTLTGLLDVKMNVILQGAPGVGKTFAARRLAYSVMGKKAPDRVMLIQFHQSYTYEDFIEGFRPTGEGAGFELKKGAFYNFCKKAESDPENKYFFIIDEINRGNLSKIFGELFMLVEKDKRGQKLSLLYSDEPFGVPENLYIIGTMNTADRSLAMLDYALRRRFAFYTMKPLFASDGFVAYKERLSDGKFDALIDCVKSLNDAIASDDALGEGFCIGHSYFCNVEAVTPVILNNIVEYELIPLLSEYWFDESDKVRIWSERLRSTLK